MTTPTEDDVLEELTARDAAYEQKRHQRALRIAADARLAKPTLAVSLGDLLAARKARR